MQGNNCVQILTGDDGFVVAVPMRSKAESENKIQSVCRDVCLTNELHMDNAPEQTGHNKKLQEVCR